MVTPEAPMVVRGIQTDVNFNNHITQHMHVWKQVIDISCI